MSSDESSTPPPSPADGTAQAESRPLPPVEAPTGTFIVQLFLVPLVIVTIIVGTWLLVGWLAHADADPYRLAEDIRRQGPGSWQKAYTLSNMLHSRQYEGLRRDRKLCGILIAALEDALPVQVEKDEDVQYRVFLCRALGEFDVGDPLPILVQAMQLESSQPTEVRLAAVQGLAVIADRLGSRVIRQRPEVTATLVAITQEPPEGEDPRAIRELQAAAAFALGVVGGDAATHRLVALLDDAYPNTRYNAATGLAWQGDARALPVLLEMLDPDNPALLQGERTGSQQATSPTTQQVLESRQLLVISSAISAVTRLCRSSAEIDRQAVRKALEKIARSRIPSSVKLEATEALIVLKKSEQ